ncbi:MAG: cytidylate kinase family protein [Treponema sp.]|nr:cytidylate kinase family protein [Treponema sp.]
MAIISISRQVAALGDEIATALADKIGYAFIDRKRIEKRIVELGFPQSKLSKYDERKPGFFASLVKDRDEYLNYLQYAILDEADKGNCILIGRGSSSILEDIPNLISLRFVSKDSVRLERLKKEFSWNDKQAQVRIDESDSNRKGFHKSFFNMESEDPQHYLMTLNTSILSIDESVRLIESIIKFHITSEKEAEGKKQVSQRLKGQRLVNQLIFDFHININFLRAVVDGDVITLQGVADSQGLVERAVQTAAKLLPTCEIRSAISIVQDFKTY